MSISKSIRVSKREVIRHGQENERKLFEQWNALSVRVHILKEKGV